jgi:hypothetical protein
MEIQNLKRVVEIHPNTGGTHTCDICGENVRFGTDDGVLSHYFSKHGYTLFRVESKRALDDQGNPVSQTVAILRPN